MTKKIPDIKFIKEKQFEFDILNISSLFNKKVDHIIYNPHRVHFYHIILFTKGSGEHIIDFKTYNYEPKTLLFVATNQVHQFTHNKEVEGIIIVFTSEFLYKSESDRKILELYRVFDYSLESPCIDLSEQEFNFFIQLFNEIKDEFKLEEKSYLKEELIRNLLRVILLKAERLKQNQVLQTKIDFYNDFKLFRELLDKKYTKTRNVKEYALELNLSTKKLNQSTQNILGKTAKEFIDDRVILEVKRLLVHTDLSVQEISFRVGFEETTNLVKFFKKYTELTPMAFRLKEKNNL